MLKNSGGLGDLYVWIHREAEKIRQQEQKKTAAEGEFDDTTTPATAKNTNGKKPVSKERIHQNERK